MVELAELLEKPLVIIEPPVLGSYK
jgi:hypothetical protein